MHIARADTDLDAKDELSSYSFLDDLLKLYLISSIHLSIMY